MKYLINNKIYDTESAEKIINYIRFLPVEGILGYEIKVGYKCILYKTKKGQFLSIMGNALME